MRGDKRTSLKSGAKGAARGHKRGVAGYSKKTALLEEAITQMNAGKYGRSSAALKELLSLDPQNMEARRLFATLHLRLGSLIPARQAFDTLITESFQRQDYWLAESLLREYLAAGPRCVPFLEKLGLIYQEKGDVQEAVTEYGKAIDILIEDPDPDNPQLVSQLYKKVRDLAPASPVGIRLASFFDAQTGELLAREPNRSETVTESPVPAIDESTVQEPVNGVMPWDIETSQGEHLAPHESVPHADSATHFTVAKDTRALCEDPTTLGQGEQFGEVPREVQTERSMSEHAPVQSSEFTHPDEGRGDLPAQAEVIVSIDVGAQEAHAVTLSSNLAVEAQAGLLEPHATGMKNPPALAQGADEPIQQAADTGPICTTESSEPQYVTSDQSAATKELTASIEEPVSPIVLQNQITSSSLSEAVPTVPDVSVGSHKETSRDIPVSEVPGQVSRQSPAEPWKEPGFSWESLFDRAWSFGGPASAGSPDQDATQAKSETPGISEHTHQDHSSIESEAAQIPERADRDAVAAELTSTGSLKPMPWDQIQESVIPIPPAQVEEPQVGAIATAEGPSILTTQDEPQVESKAVEIPESAKGEAVAAELTTTGSLKPMPWDQIQESVIPIPPAQVGEPQAGTIATAEGPSVSTAQDESQVESKVVEIPESAGSEAVAAELTATATIRPMPWDDPQAGVMATAEEQLISITSAAEIVEVDQDQSATLTTEAPSSEEIQSPAVSSFPAIPSSSEPDMTPVQACHLEPEVSSQGVSTELSLAEPLSGREQSKSDEATEIDSTLVHTDLGESASVVAQTDEAAQSLRLRLSNAQDAKQESAVPHSSNARELEAKPISESDQPRELLRSSTDKPDPVEDFQAVPLSRIEERTGDRGKETIGPQRVIVEECASVSSSSSKSHIATPQWQTLEPEAASRVEHEPSSAVPVEPLPSSPSSDMMAAVQSHDHPQPHNLVLTESTQKSSQSAVQQEEWAKTSESIRFVEEAPASSDRSSVTAESQQESVSPPNATIADDARYMSSRNVGREAPREREAESPSQPKIRSERRGIGEAIQDFIGSCFSTTRAIVATCVGLILLSLVAVAVGIGIVGLTWISMEEGPSPAYQRFTTIPQQTLSDVKKNGYFLLVGFDAPAQLDPIQAGYEGKTGVEQVAMGRACQGDTQKPSGQQPNASAHVSKSWFRSADPVGQFRSHSETVRGWVSQQASALSRYGRWHTLPFEDWGYGQTTGLPCASIIFAHELYLADGFLHAMEEGVERLETDMEAWRIVLGQARTLSVKTLALQAMNDDIAVASGLLVRPDLDGKYLGRLSKLLRPLDQPELSIRWPMQSELVSAAKTYEAQVKAAKTDDQSVYAVMASTLSLPKQRRLNDYAEYYEASYKAVGEGHHSTLPKWKDYIRTPATGLSDYMANPIENIIGLESLPPWDVYHGQVMDTEARLRLASLQAWLRRGPTDGDVLTRLAKAGQKFYDPYTGLPMLVNMKKAALYSVGHDGKDQDADPQFDVVVTIPTVQAHATQPSTKSSAESSKP